MVYLAAISLVGFDAIWLCVCLPIERWNWYCELTVNLLGKRILGLVERVEPFNREPVPVIGPSRPEEIRSIYACLYGVSGVTQGGQQFIIPPWSPVI